MLDRAIPEADRLAVDLVVDTVRVTLERIAVRFDNRDKRTGRPRRPDRPDVARIAAALNLDMAEVGRSAAAGDTGAALATLKRYRERATELVAAYPQGS